MEYPNRGTLWNNKFKKQDTHPDLTGDIKLELDVVRDLLDSCTTDHVVIKLDGWLGKDRDGNRRVSLKLNTYKKPEQSQSSSKDPWDE